MNSIKVAVIGLGGFGALELDILDNLPGVEVIALVSRSEERARELADRYQVPHIFQSTDEMINNVRLDAVFVVTEDNRHFEPTMLAFKAGIDVFCEKPISDDLTEARKMIDEAARLNRKLMIGHVARFDPRYAIIKDRINKG